MARSEIDAARLALEEAKMQAAAWAEQAVVQQQAAGEAKEELGVLEQQLRAARVSRERRPGRAA